MDNDLYPWSFYPYHPVLLIKQLTLQCCEGVHVITSKHPALLFGLDGGYSRIRETGCQLWGKDTGSTPV